METDEDWKEIREALLHPVIPSLTTEDDLAPYMDGDLGIRTMCESAAEDAVNTGERIDWEDLLDEVLRDIEELRNVDLGSSLETPAIKAIERMLRKFVRGFREAG